MDISDTTRRAYELINAGDIDGFGDLLADDFVEHEETPGFATTKEGVLEFFRMYRTAFPDPKPVDLLESRRAAASSTTCRRAPSALTSCRHR